MVASTRHSGWGPLWVPLLLWVVAASLQTQNTSACGLSLQQACNSCCYSHRAFAWLASAAGCWVMLMQHRNPNAKALPAAQEPLGGAAVHSRRLLQPKIDEARDEGGDQAGARAGTDAAASAAEEAPLTLTLSDSTGKKLYRRAGEVRQAGSSTRCRTGPEIWAGSRPGAHSLSGAAGRIHGGGLDAACQAAYRKVMRCFRAGVAL